MGWMECEPLRLFCPGGADVLVGCESFEGLESSGEVVGLDEVGEMLSEVSVSFVVEAFDGGFLECSIHAFDLSVGPGVFRFGQAVVDVGLGAGELEGMSAEEFSAFRSKAENQLLASPASHKKEQHSYMIRNRSRISRWKRGRQMRS